MQVELTDEEEYFVEKVLDNHRDGFLMGLAQHVNLITKDGVPQEFKDLTNNRLKDYVKTFDMLHTICAKFEQARLGGKNR